MMKAFQLVRCGLGHHLRDSRHIRHDGGGYRSTCTGCGRPMLRTLDGWRLDHDREDAEREPEPEVRV